MSLAVISRIMLKFPDRLYVGFKNNATFDTTEYPLGFATPFGTDKAFEKRKATVDQWCIGWGRNVSYEGTVIDNVPVEGFLLVDVEERCATSNKLFRLQDPRGMTLEISAENMLSLMLTGKVEHGLIDGPCIWGRQGGANWLTRANDPCYASTLLPQKKTLDVGDIVDIPRIKSAVYLGHKYLAMVDRTPVIPSGVNHWEIKPRDMVWTYTKKVAGPLHCFKTRRHKTDYTMVYEKLPTFVFRENDPTSVVNVAERVSGRNMPYNFVSFLFDTLDEAKDFVYDPDIHGQ